MAGTARSKPMLDKLEPRERLFLFGGLIFAALAGLYFLGAAIHDRRENASRQVQEARQAAREIRELRASINSMQAAEPLPGVNEFQAQLAQLMESSGLKEPRLDRGGQEQSEAQTRIAIEAVVRSVRLEDLIRFIHSIEYSRRTPAPVIENINIRRAVSQRETYDVNMRITMTGAPAEGGAAP